MPPAIQHRRERRTASSRYSSPITTATTSGAEVWRRPARIESISSTRSRGCERAEHLHHEHRLVVLFERLADLTHQHVEDVVVRAEHLRAHAVRDDLEARAR